MAITLAVCLSIAISSLALQFENPPLAPNLAASSEVKTFPSLTWAIVPMAVSPWDEFAHSGYVAARLSFAAVFLYECFIVHVGDSAAILAYAIDALLNRSASDWVVEAHPLRLVVCIIALKNLGCSLGLGMCVAGVV